MTIFLILGTVIGSGFSTGKEIAVFFSRFGHFSFLFIPLAFVLFYISFVFLMQQGGKRRENSKKTNIIMIFCACIFSASMFAGIQNCIIDFNFVLKTIFTILVLIACFVACFKKLLFLSKINLFLIPILLIILGAFLCTKLSSVSLSNIKSIDFLTGFFGGGFFCALYVVLNLSLSSVVIASCGEGMTKKQIRFSGFVSALILSVFIFVINLVIISDYDLIQSSMPILNLSGGVMNTLLHIAIIVGCLTTLLSMVYISALSCLRLKFGKMVMFVVSVLLPFSLSLVGFSKIVSNLYPFASFLGIILLFLQFRKKMTS